MSSPFIVLDRDGVINEDSDDYIKSPQEWLPIPGSIEAIADLSRSGYEVVVATNQSGLGRGYFDEASLARMHDKMHALVEAQGGNIAGVFYCPHLPDEACRCRKPGPGLLEQIEAEFGTSLRNSWFIGDSEKDLDCALAKDCRPALVLTGKGQATHNNLPEEKLEKIKVFDDLRSATDHILETNLRDNN